jgi:sec-independent protein translocase protein TatB
MFDFDAGKLILIGIVALIVIGPKDLPRVLRELGRAVGKMRRMASEFQGQFMEAVREADMADIKDEVAKLGESAKFDVAFNPVADIKNEIKAAVDSASPSAALSAPAPKPAVEASLNALEATPDGAEAVARGALADERASQNLDHTPDKNIDAEMQALADALKAEIGAAPKGEAALAPGRASTLHDNA